MPTSSIPTYPPCGSHAARLSEDPASDAHHVAGLLRGAQEVARQQEPEVGMAPAHERFHGLDPARDQRDDGLEGELELALAIGAADLVHDREVTLVGGMEVGAVDLPAVAALALRMVEGAVGLAEQALGTRVVPVGASDPDARRHAELATSDGDRFPKARKDPVREDGRRSRRVAPDHGHRELIAADARHLIVRPDRPTPDRGPKVIPNGAGTRHSPPSAITASGEGARWATNCHRTAHAGNPPGGAS